MTPLALGVAERTDRLFLTKNYSVSFAFQGRGKLLKHSRDPGWHLALYRIPSVS